jgi:synaptobrevin family protein YKT6
MVILYALNVLFKGPNTAIWLKSAYDLSACSFFQRSSVQEFMAFVSKTIVERTQTAARQSVKEGGKLLSFNGNY